MPEPCVQVITECVRIRKITIQIHFCEKQGDILEILPLQAASFFPNLASVSADVFII